MSRMGKNRKNPIRKAQAELLGEHCCAYCGIKFNNRSKVDHETIEHVVPWHKCRKHEKNVVVVCRRCNKWANAVDIGSHPRPSDWPDHEEAVYLAREIHKLLKLKRKLYENQD